MGYLTRTSTTLLTGTLLIAATMLTTRSAQAHHSIAMFDDHRSVTVRGTVTRYEWANPHVYIYLMQQDDRGAVQWQIESSPPSILHRLGWSLDTLHPGDTITVIGMPARDPARKSLRPISITIGNVTLFDSKREEAQLASPGVAPDVAAKGLDGVWLTPLATDVEDRLDGDKLALTSAGAAAYKHFDEKTMHPGANCVANSAPTFMITPDLKRITESAGVIVIEGEFDGAQRTIHMGTATHEGAPTSIQGHSIGRWDGNSLVIDTTQFANHAMGNAYGVPSGPRKHLIERLTPNPDGMSLTYHFELTDPDFLTAPVTGDLQWVFRPNLSYAPPKCDLSNARRFIRG